MMPHKHLIVSIMLTSLIILIFFSSLSYTQVFLWISLAGIFSVLIDADSIILLFLSKDKRLKPYKNQPYLNSHFTQFLKTFSKTGLLKIAMTTHIIFSILYLSITYLFAGIYFTPIAIGIVSHLLIDIPNLKYL